ncbi:MAG: hypothetical protein Q9160_007228 [Pyrenula sp. 1 TL-2023]
MKKSVHRVALGALALFTCSQAWIIDKSCDVLKDDLVKKALLSAGTLSRQAHAALDANPRAQSTNDLYNMLFDDIDQARTRVKDVLKGVGDRIPANSNAGTDRWDQDEIVVYCDFSRIQDIEGNKWDPASEEYVTDDDDYKQCASKSAADVSPLAYTSVFKNPTEGDPARTPPTIVQLCPWFVQLIKDKKYPDMNLPSFKNFAANLWIAKNKISGTVNQMDIFALLDHVVLHELTHSKGLETQDVGGFPKAYFWANVQKENMIGGSNNADSITYFAQGIDLIVNHNTIPKKDGNMEPSQSLLSSGAAKLRRLVEMIWKA